MSSTGGTPPTLATPSHQSDRILGFREQILANAAVVFPWAVQSHIDRFLLETTKPQDVFDIIIVLAEKTLLRAILVYGPITARQIAAQGAGENTTEQALDSLLALLTAHLGIWFQWHKLPPTDGNGPSIKMPPAHGSNLNGAASPQLGQGTGAAQACRRD
ncbi:Hypothetical predicted protein [Lecanosticta acicola]|uniref:Uncharacterized protein n=1 Tax=Lecanosticta acicola TaxID=111012 RepID=A0AAI8YYE8_9PEZI|nr:Hypothetical predicted protein [Lecanosticta acicola]